MALKLFNLVNSSKTMKIVSKNFFKGLETLAFLLILANWENESTLCYKLKAPFLIDNSIKPALANFDHMQTTLVEGF